MSRKAWEAAKPDYTRLTRTNDLKIRQQRPPEPLARDNAEQIVNKAAATLNLAGATPESPILSGLGVSFVFYLSSSERLEAVHIHQDPGVYKSNLKPSCTVIATNAWALSMLAGAGTSVAGTHLTGAMRNFLRVVTNHGARTREFWIRSRCQDAVVLEEQNAHDANLDPVTIRIPTAGTAWLPVAVEFFKSWETQFGRPAYGGARFVSLFDTTPGTEGVGSECTPLNQVNIEGVKTIQVDNGVGTKELTFRFRSRKDSPYFVDIPVVIEVTASECPPSSPPVIEPCADILLLRGTETPYNTPNQPTVPGVPPVPGTPGDPISQDLLVIAVRGASEGDPTLVVKEWRVQESSTDLSGAQFIEGPETEYIPYSDLPATTPDPGSPYQSPRIYAVVLSVQVLRAANVAALTVLLKDGALYSKPVLVVGPALRNVALFPPGEAGGGTGCCGPDGCIGSPYSPIPPST